MIKNIYIKNKYFETSIGFSLLIYLVYVSYYISGYSSGIHNYVLTVLLLTWVFFAMAGDLRSFTNAISSKAVLFAFLFLIYYFITSIVNGNMFNTIKYIFRYIMFFSCIIQFEYYKKRNRINEIKFIVIGVLIVWLFFSVKAILFYLSNPSAARILASDFYAFDNIAIGGGYAIAFGSALLCVYLFERLICEKQDQLTTKIVFLIFVVVLYFLLIKTESTLTLIACSVGIIIAFIRRPWRKECSSFVARLLVFSLLFFAVLYFLLNMQQIGQWIFDATKIDVDNTILRRFNRIGQKLMYSGTGMIVDNYVDERYSYITLSWNTFLQNPIFGVGFRSGNIFSQLERNGVGMHSAFCDLLAQHGIIGTIPFVMFCVQGLTKECKTKYNTFIISMLFMAYVNPLEFFHVFMAIFTLIPMIDIYLDSRKK